MQFLLSTVWALSPSLVSLSSSSNMLLMTFPRTKHPPQPRPSQHSSQWAMSISARDEGLRSSDTRWQMDPHSKFYSFFCCLNIPFIIFYCQFKFDWSCQMPVLMVSSRSPFDSLQLQFFLTNRDYYFYDSLILNGSDIHILTSQDDPSSIMHLGQARVHKHNDTVHGPHPRRAPYCSMSQSHKMQITRPCPNQDLCKNEIFKPVPIIFVFWQNAFSTWQ